MKLTINNTTIDLTNKDGKVFANTKDIADVFEKRNKDVMDKVDLTILSLPEYSRKYRSSTYTQENGKASPMYELDRDMFSIVVMGFTGAKAS